MKGLVGMIALLEKTIDIIADVLSSKPRLQFAITGTRPSELDNKELRTKYSNSDYSIEIYNLGQTPFILDRYTLVHKKGMLIECPVTEEDKTLSQQKNMVYILQEQDAETLRWFCKRDKFKKCKAWAYDITGKCIKAKLDVSGITFQAQISAEDMIVTE